jgi:dihydrofolate reductase
MVRFANALNPMRKIVFSRTMKKADWNTQVKAEVIPEEIREIKSATQGDILLSGGATLARIFINNGLVDEYQLVVQPVAIREGNSLFRGIGSAIKMEYQWIHNFKSGAVVLCYRPRKQLLAQRTSWVSPSD